MLKSTHADTAVRRFCFTLLIVVGIFLLPRADAQVTVRQLPAVEKPPDKMYHSPMELESALVLKLPSPEQNRPFLASVSGFAPFVCDDVSVRNVTFEVRRPKKGQVFVPVKITAEVYTQESYDRLADLTLTLLLDGKEVGVAAFRDIDAEETKTRRVSTELPLRVDSSQSEFKLALKARLVVKDNR